MYLKDVDTLRGVSSAGRAPALQAGGHRFDPGTLHHQKKRLIEISVVTEVSLSFFETQTCTLKTEHCEFMMQL